MLGGGGAAGWGVAGMKVSGRNTDIGDSLQILSGKKGVKSKGLVQYYSV